MESEKIDIFEQMPSEKKETFVRRMSEKRQRHERPARYSQCLHHVWFNLYFYVSATECQVW